MTSFFSQAVFNDDLIFIALLILLVITQEISFGGGSSSISHFCSII